MNNKAPPSEIKKERKPFIIPLWLKLVIFSYAITIIYFFVEGIIFYKYIYITNNNNKIQGYQVTPFFSVRENISQNPPLGSYKYGETSTIYYSTFFAICIIYYIYKIYYF